MSRSVKRSKFSFFSSASSEKQDKRDANRKYRRQINQILHIGKKDFPKVREVSNVWTFDKDGKVYDPEMSEKQLRK